MGKTSFVGLEPTAFSKGGESISDPPSLLFLKAVLLRFEIETFGFLAPAMQLTVNAQSTRQSTHSQHDSQHEHFS